MLTCALRMPPPALFGFVKEGEGCPRLCHTFLNAKIIIIGSLCIGQVLQISKHFTAFHLLALRARPGQSSYSHLVNEEAGSSRTGKQPQMGRMLVF